VGSGQATYQVVREPRHEVARAGSCLLTPERIGIAIGIRDRVFACSGGLSSSRTNLEHSGQFGVRLMQPFTLCSGRNS
jgi:hypothetical protein